MIALQNRVPSILIASHGEWVGRSVESVLEINGYGVLRVESGRQALELARTTRPDGLILDMSLADIGGIEICRTLHDDPLFDQSVPIFLTAPGPVSNRVRALAYEAGGWDFCSQPLDVETLLLKMGTFLRARRQTASQGSTLLDPSTGVYTSYGLHHWAEHLGARATRKHEPFACVAVTLTNDIEQERTPRLTTDEVAMVGALCLAESRKSDIVAYVGESQFAILAPETDDSGARSFVGRLKRAAERRAPDFGGARQPLQAGFCAVTDFASAGLPAIEVVRRAHAALRFALSGLDAGGLQSFDELPLS